MRGGLWRLRGLVCVVKSEEYGWVNRMMGGRWRTRGADSSWILFRRLSGLYLLYLKICLKKKMDVKTFLNAVHACMLNVPANMPLINIV